MFDLENLQRVLALVQKTGDKMVLLSEGQEPIVLMNLKQYESLSAPAKQVLAGGVMFRVTSEDVSHLKGLTEDQMLEKVNREISIWKAENGESQPQAGPPLADGVRSQESENEVEEKFYIEPVEQL